jgi:MAP/microtubule affinity-regulating kinase
MSNKKFAIKIYEKYKLLDPIRKNSVKREIEILKKVDHNSIVKLFEVIDTSKQILLVMELVNGISLLNHLKAKTNRRLDEEEAKIIFKQVLEGVRYLHNKNIFHRDIKLENLIIDENKIVKIIDFGFATVNPKSKLLNFFCGTPSYMPPEIVQKKDYLGPPTDVWSCGILLYTILSGSFPFRGMSQK